ncbi:MAG: cytochrome c [Bacteroidota bacterium]
MKKAIVPVISALLLLTVYSCGSSKQTEAPPPFTADDNAASTAVNGESIYKRTCVTCHQGNGEGIPVVYPPLAKSDFLLNKEQTIAQVIHGQSGEITVNGKKYNNTMPPQPLNDEEVAAVLTYVYGNFGNGGGTITPAEVKAVRDKK